MFYEATVQNLKLKRNKEEVMNIKKRL